MNNRIRRIAFAAVVLVACNGERAVRPPLVEVPRPDLVAVEAPVRERLEKMRSVLDAAAAQDDAPAATLGRMYGEAGMLYHAYGLADAARGCYTNARRLAPDEPAWPYFLGSIDREQGRSREAAESFRQLLETSPDHVPALLRAAEIGIEGGLADEAEALYRHALSVDPDSAAARFGLGKVAAARRDYRAAVGHFEAALGLAPEATEIEYPLGLAYRGLGDDERAREHIERRGHVAIPDPMMARVRALAQDWRTELTRGGLLFAEGLYEQAAAAFRRAVQAAPEDASARTNLGSALHKLGDYDGARKEFEEAIRLDPRAAQAHFNLGTLSAKLGDDKRAVRHYHAALAAEPGMLDAHFNLANALRRLGRFEEALPQYRAVVEADPGNAAARQGEVFNLVRLGRWQDAARRAEEGATALGDDPELRHVLARLLAASPVGSVRDGQRALEIARALVAEEHSLPYIVTAAMAAAEAGRFELAVEWQTAAIDAVTRSQRTDLLPELEENLRHYRAREPCRTPWLDSDPVLSPRPGRTLRTR